MSNPRISRLAAFLVALALAPLAGAQVVSFTADIDRAQAANCTGTGSPHTGTGVFTLDTATGAVTYDISYTGLVGTESVAHVHGNAPACTSAGVVYALPAGNPKIGSTTLSPAQQTAMLNGLHYVNIHSSFDGGGELRGQILRCVEDLDGDTDIGFSDLLLILSQWGPCPACPEDLDADGDVGFSDLLLVLSAWGPCS